MIRRDPPIWSDVDLTLVPPHEPRRHPVHQINLESLNQGFPLTENRVWTKSYYVTCDIRILFRHSRGSWSLIQSKMLLIIIIASAVAVGGGITTFAIGIPNSPCFRVAGTTRHFTIVADINGYNDSRDHQGLWPVINVSRCDQVVIEVINNDTQTHGFAVETYARGTDVVGQQQATINFLASKAGEFRVYCIVFCTVHIFMQNGLLNVT